MAKLAWRYADTFEFMEQTRAGFPPAMICVHATAVFKAGKHTSGFPNHPMKSPTRCTPPTRRARPWCTCMRATRAI